MRNRTNRLSLRLRTRNARRFRTQKLGIGPKGTPCAPDRLRSPKSAHTPPFPLDLSGPRLASYFLFTHDTKPSLLTAQAESSAHTTVSVKRYERKEIFLIELTLEEP